MSRLARFAPRELARVGGGFRETNSCGGNRNDRKVNVNIR